jgi:hypothetical protein
LGTTQLVTLAPGDNNPQLDAGYIVPPVEVPTLSELMKLLLAMMMLSIGVIAVRSASTVSLTQTRGGSHDPKRDLT